ncbi:MAG: hypothetical protein HY320_04740 [Armatimonadetes bacterium]|nr:hypothetical protein [Armatimonadota bacterium]
MKVKVETIAAHSCTGRLEPKPPQVILELQREYGFEIEFHAYEAWTVTTADGDIPTYVREKLAAIRSGQSSPWGFFLDGEWLPLSPHNGREAVAVRQTVAARLGGAPEAESARHVARAFNRIAWESSVVASMHLVDSRVDTLTTSCADFDKVHLSDGTVEELIVDCRVRKFQFAGYDVLKLVALARQHPELFTKARIPTSRPDGGPVPSEEIIVRLLTEGDLASGRHPCYITGGQVDADSRLLKETTNRFGGWGYVARHGYRVCGWMGVALKDVVRRDGAGYAGFNPPDDEFLDRTLLLTCIFAGGAYGGEYAGIGVATRLVMQAVADAKARGFRRVEGNPHDPGIGRVFEKCGFSRVEWEGGGNSPLRDRAFYRRELE